MFTSHPHLPLNHPPSLALVPNACMLGNLVRARPPLRGCQPQSAVILCEMCGLVQGSQGQGLVIDVAYSSVSCVFSPSLHSGHCLDKLFEDLL